MKHLSYSTNWINSPYFKTKIEKNAIEVETKISFRVINTVAKQHIRVGAFSTAVMEWLVYLIQVTFSLYSITSRVL